MTFFDFSLLSALLCCAPMFMVTRRRSPDENPDDPDDQADADLLADFEVNLRELADGTESADDAALRERIDAAEKRLAAGEEIPVKTLCQDYLTLALEAQEDDRTEKALPYFHRALELLSDAARRNDSVELLRMFGLTRLSHAVALNDLGRWEEALNEYGAAEKTLSQLADDGDSEARLDLAGVRLNVATIRFEQGDAEKALTLLANVEHDFIVLAETDQSSEALFYRAKTNLLAASILEQLDRGGEATPYLEKAVRFFRELLADGRSEYQIDLADALQSLAEHWSEEPRAGADPLAPISEAVALYRETISRGASDAYFDLLGATLTKGALLTERSRFADALALYDESLELFAPLSETGEPTALYQLAELYEGRADARSQSGDRSGAVDDYSEGIALRERLLQLLDADDHDDVCGHDDCHDPDCHHAEELRFDAQVSLMTALGNRSKSLALEENRPAALDDCRRAAEILETLRDYLGDDYDEFHVMFERLEERISEQA